MSALGGEEGKAEGIWKINTQLLRRSPPYFSSLFLASSHYGMQHGFFHKDSLSIKHGHVT